MVQFPGPPVVPPVLPTLMDEKQPEKIPPIKRGNLIKRILKFVAHLLRRDF
jgi:hypothetical protein